MNRKSAHEHSLLFVKQINPYCSCLRTDVDNNNNNDDGDGKGNGDANAFGESKTMATAFFMHMPDDIINSVTQICRAQQND